MGSYSLIFKSSVEKDFRRIASPVISRLTKKTEALRTDPFPPQSEKLSSAERLYRIRVGDYRIVYEVDVHLKQITIHYVRHRREVYRKLEVD
jgi:mRNA interferase RelE/StbE